MLALWCWLARQTGPLGAEVVHLREVRVELLSGGSEVREEATVVALATEECIQVGLQLHVVKKFARIVHHTESKPDHRLSVRVQ